MEGRTNGWTQPLLESWLTTKDLYGKDDIPSHYALTFGIVLLKNQIIILSMKEYGQTNGQTD